MRPAGLPDDDDDLRGALRAAHFASKKSQPDKRLLRDFGAWRAAVWAVEEQAVGNVQVVACAWASFAASRDVDGARACRAFLESEYDLERDATTPGVILEIPRFAQRVARRRFASTLPSSLANFLD